MKMTLHLSALLLLLSPQAGLAASPSNDASMHNAAFEAGTQWGVSPQTVNERLICAGVWDRWDYAVASAADPVFTKALRRELSSAHAKKRKIFWTRKARRTDDAEDDPALFKRDQAKAEEKADDIYAAYINNEQRGMEKFMEWLGICK
ncbi:MAG: hypothetical protein HC843_03120 [Sphingomonadales bacterium]|nr:hypothetical protein [Sphingomonadales bacterium]